jgi:hypothetical protein
MSRSGYTDDYDDEWATIRWRGAVASAIRGKRGQAFLREMLAALDAMPEKQLIADELESNGEVCAIGAVGKARGLDMSGIDPEDHERIANTFNISNALAREIMFENDEGVYLESPNENERRYLRIRRWIEGNLIDAK